MNYSNCCDECLDFLDTILFEMKIEKVNHLDKLSRKLFKERIILIFAQNTLLKHFPSIIVDAPKFIPEDNKYISFTKHYNKTIPYDK